MPTWTFDHTSTQCFTSAADHGGAGSRCTPASIFKNSSNKTELFPLYLTFPTLPLSLLMLAQFISHSFIKTSHSTHTLPTSFFYTCHSTFSSNQGIRLSHSSAHQPMDACGLCERAKHVKPTSFHFQFDQSAPAGLSAWTPSPASAPC